MFAGQNESKMLRNSRQREVETALWCLTILIWVRVCREYIVFGAAPVGVRFFFTCIIF